MTKHIVDFYLRLTERLFTLAPGKIDMFFFGNDFGTQHDILTSPEMSDRFVMPCFRKFAGQAHVHGMKALLHSCGSICKVLPRRIDTGVDALHPIQARTAHMDAEPPAHKFNGRIAFLGGVDTQRNPPFGTPRQVRNEVRHLRDLFGEDFIVSPSYESVLPEVPWENVLAMAQAAAE